MIVKVIPTLFSGAIYIPRAIRLLLRRPGLWLYCIAPIIIASILGVGAIAVVLGPIAHWLLPTGIFTGPWYMDMLVVVVISIIITASIFFTFALANLIAGPFNEILSQRVEELVRHSTDATEFAWKTFWTDSWRAIKEESKTFIVLGSVQLLVLLLNLIPGIGSVVYMIVNVPLVGLLMAYEYLDLPLSRHGSGFKDKVKYIRQQPIRHLGFGWVCALLMFVPVLNILFLPVCVIAGTLLYCDHEAANQA